MSCCVPLPKSATALLNAMAEQQGYTLVVDISNPQSNVVFANPKNDITEELVKRIDAEAAKAPASSEAPPKTAPPAGSAAPRPPATTPAAPKAPAATTHNASQSR